MHPNQPLRNFVLASTLGAALMLLGQPQADGRELGFAVSTAQDGDLLEAVAKAQAACMSATIISVGWSELHPDTLSWNAAVIGQLDLINAYFFSIGVKVDLQLRPVNTVVEEMPAELAGLPYDDPLVVHALLQTLDTVLGHLPDVELSALNIGNESDALWGTDTSRYTAFGTLLQAVKPHAKALYEASHGGDTLSVGTTFTWGGLTGAVTGPLCQITNASADHISVTYYGIENDFSVKPPSDVIPDLDLLTTLQPGIQPIRLAEIGYPTSSVCGSSEQLQSEFVQYAFSAWDQHMDRINYMSWFLTTDLDSATVEELGNYYGISAPVFLEYLRTLGLRTWPGAGTDKLAYQTLLCELQARGFCATSCPNGIPETSVAPAFSLFPVPASDRIAIPGTDLRPGEPVQFISMTGQSRLVMPFSTDMDISALLPGTYAVFVPRHAPARLIVAR